jgi:hypothetical protein
LIERTAKELAKKVHATGALSLQLVQQKKFAGMKPALVDEVLDHPKRQRWLFVEGDRMMAGDGVANANRPFEDAVTHALF